MNLNRRDFAKTGLGGLVAFLLPALAKVKPKSGFPRFFVPREYTLLPRYAYLEWRAEGSVVRISPDGREFPIEWLGFERAMARKSRNRYWREITAAEAEALLKPRTGFYRGPLGLPYKPQTVK